MTGSRVLDLRRNNKEPVDTLLGKEQSTLLAKLLNHSTSSSHLFNDSSSIKHRFIKVGQVIVLVPFLRLKLLELGSATSREVVHCLGCEPLPQAPL